VQAEAIAKVNLAARDKSFHEAEYWVRLAEANYDAVKERMHRVQADRDIQAQGAAEAREQVAKLKGQLEALQAQNAALLARLEPQG